MTKKEKDRIEELEKKIDELLARPIPQPIIVQPYVPTYPVPTYPTYPYWYPYTTWNDAIGGSLESPTTLQNF